jgi:hypothetical protein
MTWHPNLPSAPLDNAPIYAVKTWYLSGGTFSESMQFNLYGEDTNQMYKLFGCNASGKIVADFKSEQPKVLLEIAGKFASNSLGIGSLAVVTSDNSTPISTASDTEFIVSAYTAAVRDATYTETAISDFMVDLAHGLAPIPDGNQTNNIAGWLPSGGGDAVTGEVTLQWLVTRPILAMANTPYQFLLQAGATYGDGALGIYLPRVELGLPEVVDVGGIDMHKMRYTLQYPIDPTGATACGASSMIVGIWG